MWSSVLELLVRFSTNLKNVESTHARLAREYKPYSVSTPVVDRGIVYEAMDVSCMPAGNPRFKTLQAQAHFPGNRSFQNPERREATA